MGGAAKPSAFVLLPCPALADLAEEFPQYEILEFLGRGGMGAVFSARHRELERVVAIKLLLVDTLEDPSFEDRFRREARTLARLDHPNIVRLHDFGRSESGMCYLVMELVNGSNVQDLILRKEMNVSQALGLVAQLCDALQHAHEQGLVHRDVKPSNVLVDKRQRVRIADFGLAKILGENSADPWRTQTGISMGTPLYMAPEQRRGEASIDHRADLYSLGVMIYEMLTGEVPQGIFRPVSEKVTMDRRIDAVVNKALKENPTDRYQAASEVREDVRKVSCAEDAPKVRKSWVRRTLQVAVMLGLLVAAGLAMLTRKPSLEAAAPPQKWMTFEEFTPELQTRALNALVAGNPGCPPLTLGMRTGRYPKIITADEQRWRLELYQQEIKTLEPLRGSGFTILILLGSQVQDLSPLKDTPIRNLIFQPPSGFEFSQLANLSLEELVVVGGNLKSVAPVLNPALKHLSVNRTKVTDLAGLSANCPFLRNLSLSNTSISDLSPLKGMTLHSMQLDSTKVTSIEPLRGMTLQNINLRGSKIEDLSPLLDCEHLTAVQCDAGDFDADGLRAYVMRKSAGKEN